MSGRTVWPISLKADSSITLLAPADLDKTSPIRWIEPQLIRTSAAVKQPSTLEADQAKPSAQSSKNTWLNEEPSSNPSLSSLDSETQLVPRLVFIDSEGCSNYLWPNGTELAAGSINLGNGVAFNKACEFRKSEFHLDKTGIKIDFDLTAPNGKRLIYQLASQNPWQGFRFAAPPGADMADPSAFFVPYLFDFDFVAKPVEFHASYGGEPLELAKMPIWRNRRRVTGSKASIGSVIVELMADKDELLSNGSQTLAQQSGTALSTTKFHCVEKPDGQYLSQVEIEGAQHPVQLFFNPPLPPVEAVREAQQCKWELSVGGDRIASGVHTSWLKDDQVVFSIDIQRGWSGVKRPWSIWVMTRLVRFLITWPKNYIWQGSIDRETKAVSGTWQNARFDNRQ